MFRCLQKVLTFGNISGFSLLSLTILFCLNTQKAFTQPISLIRNKLPIQLEHGEGTYILTVPDKNTTNSAFGGKLRIYDAHIAKMFEVTYADCQEINAGYRDWFYYADNGKIDMGQFTISCELVAQVVGNYGLGKPETTVIAYSQEEAGLPINRTRSIPILNITEKNLQSWLNFVQGFKPIKN